MKPEQMILILAAGLGVVYFLSRKTTPKAGAVGNYGIGNSGAQSTMAYAAPAFKASTSFDEYLNKIKAVGVQPFSVLPSTVMSPDP